MFKKIVFILSCVTSLLAYSTFAKVIAGTDPSNLPTCRAGECFQWIYSISIHGGISPIPRLGCKKEIQGETACVRFSTAPPKKIPRRGNEEKRREIKEGELPCSNKKRGSEELCSLTDEKGIFCNKINYWNNKEREECIKKAKDRCDTGGYPV